MTNNSCILRVNNKHIRDSLIKFYNQGHKYKITNDKDSKYTSVTTWCHSHFPKFDQDKVIKNMMSGKNWGPGHKYWGKTEEEIKDEWKQNGQKVSEEGTKLHHRIEKFMNNNLLRYGYTHKDLYETYLSNSKSSDLEPLEWEYFLNFVKDYLNLVPFRTEWMIFDEELKLAGSVDMVYENADGTLSIYDWKRSKDISKVNTFNQFAVNPLINELHDSNFWHYSLQLNTYRKIIEKNYGRKVNYLCLVKLHPDSDKNNYELLEVPLMDVELDKLFEERRSQV
jgi:ATP-dependent exoDNAse (exonuclease V) beta subunit